jgi:flagellar hook-associated protein 2
VTINYNTTVDTLTAVLSRISASAANVTASYDATSDTVTFTSGKTGNVDITMADGAGNMLASLNAALPAAHQLGVSAKYEVNGGASQYSLSNSVTNLQPGMSVAFTAPTPVGSPLTVSVSQNSGSGSGAITNFVTAYNSVLDTIAKDTAFDMTTKQAGIFLGDPIVSNLKQQLDQLLFVSNGQALGLSSGYTDVSSIGLSTGKVGSAPGTTSSLVFDAGKFQTALAANPGAVTNLVTTVFIKFNKTAMSIVAPRGLIDGAIQSENNTIRDYGHQIDAQNVILKQREAFYNSMFQQLEQQLALLQAQASSGAAALAALTAQQAAANNARTSSTGSTGF